MRAEMADIDQLVAAVRAASAGSADDRARVLADVDPVWVRELFHAPFTVPAGVGTIAAGIAASPGAATGEIALTAADAVLASDAGRRVILVRPETSPEDVVGMQVAAGILTARGGIASHAAVVARGWGIPAVVGAAEVVFESDEVIVGNRRFRAGDVISLDGSSGRVFDGPIEIADTAPPPELSTLLGWAGLLTTGAISVRANADTAADALHARTLGADGIGLCRTEHMFLSAERLPLIRAFILSDDGSAAARDALAALEEAQVADFAALFRAMPGLPVTVRLLDPPLHEFLPPVEPLLVAEARGTLDVEGTVLLTAIRRLHESNPMIGTRGVRLGVLRSGLYQMQVRAIARAVVIVVAEGIEPTLEIMIPLVSDEAELRLARDWVTTTWTGVVPDPAMMPAIGVMIETPRSALVADRLAAHADFFSFGTNDLTQLTYGLSRDDVETRLIPAYVEAGVMEHNPFEVLDPDGVGSLISSACRRGRDARPDLRIGACGEHAGEPRSIAVLLDSGCDSLSCSPPRIPLARLAAARHLLARGKVTPAALEHAGTNVASRQPPERPAATPPDRLQHTVTATGEFPEPTTAALLHALRVRGFATLEGLVESLGGGVDTIAAMIEAAVAAGEIKFYESRGLHQLTPAGFERLAQVMPELLADEHRDSVIGSYEQFLVLNSAFKEVCTAWQTRDGQANLHDDPEHDSRCVADLAGLVESASTLLGTLSVRMPRFGIYRHRINASFARLTEGDHRMFTGVAVESVHDVWMEIHEDLIQTLGIDRSAEGSF